MNKEETNRLLATWLEPMPTPDYDPLVSPLGAWMFCCVGINRYGWRPIDFTASADGQMRLLEKMPCGRVYREKNTGKPNAWVCESDWRFFHSEASAPTLAEAIIAAAVKVALGEKKS